MSANFTPDMTGYKGLSPFRFWCQKTLPLVYDDSLSYYELLCKVVSYINNLITDVAAAEENVDKLLTAYNQLQEYVNNYFDGADFQQKIDDSLDRYAEDGTLSAMVNTHVRALLPYEVGQQIGDVVDEQLPPVVDLKLGAVVDTKLPDVVDDKLEDVVRPMIVPAVSGLLPQEVGRQLPDEVETQLPAAIGEDLGTIAPPVIQQWLNDHPDATTSVEDGSISLVKLNTVLQRLARLDGNFYPVEYDPTVTYYTDDMCTYRNTLTDVEMAYKCIATSTTGTFSAADWAVVDENDIVINARGIYDLASSIAPVYRYPNNQAIPAGTIFFYRGNARNAPYGLWRATTDIPPATFVTPSYAERVTILDLISGIDQLESDVADLKSAINAYPYAVYDPSTNESGKWLDASGVEHLQSGWDITDYLKIGKSATYYIKSRVSSDNVKSCFYDSNKSFLSAFKTGTAGDNTLIPVENARFVRFSIQSSDASDFKYSSLLFLEKIEGIAPEQIADSREIKSFRDEIISGGYYGTNGGIVASANWSHTPLYEVNENDVVSVVNAQALYAVFFDSSRTAVDSKTTENTPSNVTFSVPANVKYIGFSIVNANLSGYSCVVNGITLGALYELPWLNVASQNESIWKNKTYISHGDSITWQDGHTWGSGSDQGQVARGYQTVFSESVGLKSYNNQGKSGWSMAVVNGNGVVNTIMAISDYSVYDLCTIACGTNDFKLNVPLGTQGVIGDTTFDDTTFYGAYRKAVEYILTNSPTIRLVLMTPLQRDNSGYDVNYTNSTGYKLIDYVNAIKNIGEMYGIPVCDMYANSGFTKKTLATYTLDGLHPNTIGYIRMGNYLTGFLNAVGN